VELAERRGREDDLRQALHEAERRAADAGSARPPHATDAATAAPPTNPTSPVESVARRRPAVRKPAPEREAVPERVPVSVGGGSETSVAEPARTPPPSDLRRAVFASLTELAGDAPE